LGNLVVAAGTTVGGYVVDNAPAIKAKVMQYVNKATKGKVTNLNQIVGQASSGSVPAIGLLTRGLAKAGVNPENVLSTDHIDALAKAGGQRIVDDFRADFAAAVGAVDQTSVIHKTGDTGQELVLKQVYQWAKREFSNNPKTLKEAHVFLKMFLGMDESTLDHVIALHG